jgi:hypothetical protein
MGIGGKRAIKRARPPGACERPLLGGHSDLCSAWSIIEGASSAISPPTSSGGACAACRDMTDANERSNWMCSLAIRCMSAKILGTDTSDRVVRHLSSLCLVSLDDVAFGE